MRLTALSHTIVIGVISTALTACSGDGSSLNFDDINNDQSAPTLTLSPELDSSADVAVSSTMTINGTVEDSSGIKTLTYQLNNDKPQNIPVDTNGVFNQVIALYPGNNEIVITATDSKENSISTTKEIYLGETLAAAGSHTGALKDGKLYAWGRNNFGQVGLGYTSKLVDGKIHPNVPYLINNAPANIASISFNQNHSLALTKTGDVYSWGEDRYDQLGRGDNGRSDCSRTADCRLDIGKIDGINNAVMLATGFKHNLVLDKEGNVWAFGNNTNGQLGNGTTENSSRPIKVDFSQATNAGKIVQIVASADSSLALDDKGQVWAWGSNQYGTLGQGNLCDTRAGCQDVNSAPLLVKVIPDSDNNASERVIQLATGRDHVLALTNQQRVYGWGLNASSQVGYNGEGFKDTPNAWADAIATPTLLPWFKDKAVRRLYANGNTSYALMKDGTLYPWGMYGETNSEGKTIYASLNEPTDKLPQLKDIKGMAVGALHQIARDKEETLYSWGWSFEGSLGGGESTTNIWMYNVPFPVTLPAGS